VLNAPAGSNGQPIKQISGGILNGKALTLPKPVYPAEARAEKAIGGVSVQVLIDEDGKVISATAVSGPVSLRAAAVEAARAATFPPTKLSGMPVKVSGVINYDFVLERTEASIDNNLILLFGSMISVVRSDNAELKGFFTEEGKNFNSFLKDLAVEVPASLKSEQALFDQLARAPATEQAAIGARLSTAVGKLLTEDQKWHFAVGEKLIDLSLEMLRLTNDTPSGGDTRFNVSALRSLLKNFKETVDRAPSGVAPEMLTKLRTIGAFADAKDLEAAAKLAELATAFSDFMDYFPV
jgi:TonB family protein